MTAYEGELMADDALTALATELATTHHLPPSLPLWDLAEGYLAQKARAEHLDTLLKRAYVAFDAVAEDRSVAQAERDALKAHLESVTENMDRASGTQDGSCECPWCYEEGLREPFKHYPTCKLLAARAVLRGEP